MPGRWPSAGGVCGAWYAAGAGHPDFPGLITMRLCDWFRGTCLTAPPAVLALLILVLPAAARPDKADYFTITVVDEQTGRGVPLVELRTVHQVAYYTDSNGIVAFREPGLMG